MKLKKQKKHVDANVTKGLIKLICILNGIDSDMYFSRIGMWNNGICMKDKDFISSSKLKWKHTNTLEITDTIFRARFATLVCSSLLGNTKKLRDITTNRYDIRSHSKNKAAIDENRRAYHACATMVDDVLNKNYDWYDNIRDVDNCTMTLCKGVDVIELRGLIESVVGRVKRGSKYNLFTGRTRSNVGILDDILKLAYIAITTDIECTDCIGLGKLRGCDIDMDLSEFLYKYGKKLRKHIKHNKKSTNPLFIAFIRSNPKIYTNTIYASNPDVLMTCYALTYLKFIINDDTLNMFLDHIIYANIKMAPKLPKEEPVDLSSYVNMLFG
jgi:hypothetical protein